MRVLVKWILGVIVVFILYLGIELTLALNHTPGIYATTKRWIDGAPTIQVAGDSWTYLGTYPYPKEGMKSFPSEGLYKDKLYTLDTYPDPPPFVFVEKENGEYFKYKYPRFFLFP